jgi:hypothetical protein
MDVLVNVNIATRSDKNLSIETVSLVINFVTINDSGNKQLLNG